MAPGAFFKNEYPSLEFTAGKSSMSLFTGRALSKHYYYKARNETMKISRFLTFE